MEFRALYLKTARENAKGAKLPASQKKLLAKAESADPKKHKRLWKAAENISIHKYETDTGKKFTGLGDSSFINWLRENWDKIFPFIQSILKLLALFGI